MNRKPSEAPERCPYLAHYGKNVCGYHKDKGIGTVAAAELKASESGNSHNTHTLSHSHNISDMGMYGVSDKQICNQSTAPSPYQIINNNYFANCIMNSGQTISIGQETEDMMEYEMTKV